MSAHIDQELMARGVADVIVILGGPTRATATAAAGTAQASTVAAEAFEPVVKRLAGHFRASERAQMGALARAAGAALSATARLGNAAPKEETGLEAVRLYPHLGILLGTVDQQGLSGLRADSEVDEVVGAPQLSLIRPRSAETAELSALSALSDQTTWGIRDLRIPELWVKGLTGKGIRVGHLDTGVDGNHPALRDAIEKFAEFDDLGRPVLPAPQPHDSDVHGTHTAGTIAGRPIRGNRFGVAPGALLLSAMVIESGYIVGRVLGGIEWALANGMQILNLSLGIRGFLEDFLPLTRRLRARKVLPVFAVGNEGPGTSRSPGNYSEALAVGSYEESGTVAFDSSSQVFQRLTDPIVPDLVGPGVGVFSARPGGGFQFMNGTSMATPHIAGLAALLMEAAPTKTVDEVEKAIFDSCRQKPGATADRAGKGVPNAVRALALLEGQSPRESDAALAGR
jgi:subtilisin